MDIFGMSPWYNTILTIGLAFGIAAVVNVIVNTYQSKLLPKSAISIGENAKRHNNIIFVAYGFIYGTIILAGIVVPIIVSKF
ncbi:hypothetical protein FACS18949_15320 [Clostridia bacterium]|nr:hypothetical protein FACS18949_15320 [Clostridia bacterium]